MMLPPSSRNGAFGDQNGPRIEEDVGAMVPSVTSLWAISSTRLVDVSKYVICGRSGRVLTIRDRLHLRYVGLRF